MKCVRCGLESEFADAFIKKRRSFQFSKKMYCPACWSQREISAGKWVLLSYVALGIGGLLWWLLDRSHWFGPFLMSLCLLQFMLICTIVPHELGHACVARLVGWRVFRIVIGAGSTIRKWHWLGFLFEFKPWPLRGLTFVGPPQRKWYRTKLFLTVMAGPLVNVLLGSAMLLLYPWQGHPSFDIDNLPLLPRLFLLANLFILAVNLWPRTLGFAPVPVYSDGKQLLAAFFLRPTTVDDRHASFFVLAGMSCREQKDFVSAHDWYMRGLDLYPLNFNLRNCLGVNWAERGDFAKARENFVKLLPKVEKPGLQRFVLLNNIAYADALLCTAELLEEAERFSKEAYDNVPWLSQVVGTRGAVLMQSGKLEEGLNLLEQAFAKSDEATHKALNACLIAIGESRRGRTDIARKYLESARQLDSNCVLLPLTEQTLAGNIR